MVEWKKLGEVANLVRGKVLSKDYIRDFEGIYPVYSSQTTNKGLMGCINSYMFDGEYLTWTTDGAYAGTIFRRKGKFNITNVCGLIDIHENDLDQNFLYYWLSVTAKKYVIEGMGNPKLMSNVASSIEIPIPSLEEQERIVGILDTFTASIDNIKAQIEQRRKQYEHYRNTLLTFNKNDDNVEWKKLGEVCEIKGRIGFRGYTREDQVKKGEGAISLSPGNIENEHMVYRDCTYISLKKYEESPEIKIYNDDIIFCKTGSTVGKVAIVKELPCKATINPQLVVLKNIIVNSKFLYYILGTYKIQSTVKQLAGVGSVPNISQEKFGNLEFPIPTLARQQEIVSILDTFEASITNLEAQLEQRQKQYEYYREKLLTFE